MSTQHQPRPIFIICLRAQPRVEPIRALKPALKIALKIRPHGLHNLASHQSGNPAKGSADDKAVSTGRH